MRLKLNVFAIHTINMFGGKTSCIKGDAVVAASGSGAPFKINGTIN